MISKYNIGDRVVTKIHYQNDQRTVVEAVICDIELEDGTEIVKYRIHFDAEEPYKEMGCTGCEGYVSQSDIISLC